MASSIRRAAGCDGDDEQQEEDWLALAAHPLGQVQGPDAAVVAGYGRKQCLGTKIKIA